MIRLKKIQHAKKRLKEINSPDINFNRRQLQMTHTRAGDSSELRGLDGPPIAKRVRLPPVEKRGVPLDGIR